jgi:hypothetical protein
MKRAIAVLSVLLFVFINPQKIISQQTSLCELIGKNMSAVLNQFGKPIHRDQSNPQMDCVFYQNKSARMAFVADKAGVYQIQIDYYYGTKDEAEKAMNGFLSDCGSKSMKIDTVNAGDFKISKPGVRMNLTLFENSFSKKYEVKFKADRSESK